MSSRFSAGVASIFAVAAFGFFSAAPASATDFCVGFTDGACPAGATFVSNVTAGLNMGGNSALADDGTPDRIFIPAGTQLPSSGLGFEPAYDPSAFDDLEVIGAGRDSTILTTNASGPSANIILVDLFPIFNRKVTMRDLTIRVPASLPDGPGYGGGLQADGDIFTRVNFESRNTITPAHQGSSGVDVSNGGTFNDVKFFGSSGGGWGQAITTKGWFPGDSLDINNSDIVDFQGGITYYLNSGMPVHINKTHMRSEYATVMGVYNADSTITNSVIEAGSLTPFYVNSINSNPAHAGLVIKNSTILNLGGAPKAFDIEASNATPHNADVAITDSIIFGFAKTWTRKASVGAGTGNANLDISYSNFENPGDDLGGDGSVVSSVGNISQNPGFVSFNDYHLSPTSPSVDAGDPAAGGVVDDIEGTIRPLDGNGDGTAVRDMGAYEAPALATCVTDATLCPDSLAPKITKLKAKKVKKRAKVVQFSFRSSEAATVRFTFKPIGKKKPKRKTVKMTKKARFGSNSFKVRKAKLKPGRYRITVTATDAANNKSTARLKAIYLKSGKKFNVQKN